MVRHSSLVERDYRLEISARANVVNVNNFFRLRSSRTLCWKCALHWTGKDVSSSASGIKILAFLCDVAIRLLSSLWLVRVFLAGLVTA